MKTALLLLAIVIAPATGVAPQNQSGTPRTIAQPGCMNQWMMNGVWRVRVTYVEPHPGTDADGWDVTMQWGNDTGYAGVSPLDTMKQDLVLVLANGARLSAGGSTTGALAQRQLDSFSFPVSGQFVYKQSFISDRPLDYEKNKPVKLLVTFDVSKYKAAHAGDDAKFWREKTAGYDYRVDLTCSK